MQVYIALDPSVWWNNGYIVKNIQGKLKAFPNKKKTLFFASSDLEWITKPSEIMLRAFKEYAPSKINWYYQPMPNETHATIYHSAAIKVFRKLFKPEVKKEQ